MDAKLRSSLPANVCGQRFHPRALRMIQETIAEDGHRSRQEITRQVCDGLGWVDHRGRRKEMGAAVALLRFHRRGWIALPPARHPHRPTARRQPLPDGFAVPDHVLTGPLKQLGGIRLEAVTGRADSALWNGLVATFHYRGYAPGCGAQWRYRICSERGIVGAMGFAAAALAVQTAETHPGVNVRHFCREQSSQESQHRSLQESTRRYTL